DDVKDRIGGHLGAPEIDLHLAVMDRFDAELAISAVDSVHPDIAAVQRWLKNRGHIGIRRRPARCLRRAQQWESSRFRFVRCATSGERCREQNHLRCGGKVVSHAKRKFSAYRIESRQPAFASGERGRETMTMRDLPYWSKLELGPDGRRKACTQRFNVGIAKTKPLYPGDCCAFYGGKWRSTTIGR